MTNLLDDLKKLLITDERLISDKELLKNKVIELAIKLDHDLIKLLLSDEKIKTNFFTSIAGSLIFDKDKFIKFVSNKQFLPDSYTAFTNKIGLTENDEFITNKKEVVLSWPYKDCILEGDQTKEDVKRDEVFWNQTLAPDEVSRLLDPKVFTNAKRIDKSGEHKLESFKTDDEGNIKDNLIIKGNNLLALHSLKKRFAGKIKLIYIDPPFAKEADTFYNDSFKRSTWLTFMKNRLEVTQKLLLDEGFIFIHIDDRQEAYLKVLCDSIFDERNFLKTISVKVSPPNGVKLSHASKQILKEKETILVYVKNVDKVSIVPQYKKADKWDNHYNGYIEKIEKNFKYWKVVPISKILKKKGLKADLENKKFYKWMLKNSNRIFQLVNLDAAEENQTETIRPIEGIKELYSYKGRQIQFLNNSIKETPEGKTLARLVCDFWTDISFNNLFQEGGVKLKNGKKPEKLLMRIIEMTTNKDDIVLDFFLGSGTTTAVAHKMERQYIGVEQLDYGENDSVVRLKNVIKGDQTGISKNIEWKDGGNYIYLELAKWNENFVEKIKKTKTAKELNKIWVKMKKKGFLSYKVNPETINSSVKDFTKLSLNDQKRFLLECLDKNQMYINYSEIEDEDYEVTKEDKKLNKEFYG